MSVLPKIATLGSHSALQILKGAKDEGFSTVLICIKDRLKTYKMFNVADEVIEIGNYHNFMDVQDRLMKKDVVIIPHASFIEYLGNDNVEKMKLPYFGTKGILKIEADRDSQREWLRKAGLRIPRIFSDPFKIDCSVIVKFHGAKGGKGYFLANSEADFNEKIKAHPKEKYQIQEYIIGVPCYVHYFYSPLTEELEIMSFDIRYESNVDSIGRISARDQIALESIDPSYVVVGNIPVVIRESLLPHFVEIGESVIKESKKLTPKGLFGPFCLEGVLTPEQKFYVFEISARIVAGTNPYIKGSPYTDLKYDEPMSTGRRIAREIKNAFESKQMDKVIE